MRTDGRTTWRKAPFVKFSYFGKGGKNEQDPTHCHNRNCYNIVFFHKHTFPISKQPQMELYVTWSIILLFLCLFLIIPGHFQENPECHIYKVLYRPMHYNNDPTWVPFSIPNLLLQPSNSSLHRNHQNEKWHFPFWLLHKTDQYISVI